MKYDQESLKTIFNKHLIKEKTEKGYTHAKMAELLDMDDRSYIDLDHGKNGCSALTLVRFMIYCCRDRDAFLEEVRIALEADPDDIA